MGRGLGDTQRAMLDILTTAHEHGDGIWTDELPDMLGVSDRRVRAIISSLKTRGLIASEWRGTWGIGPRTTTRNRRMLVWLTPPD